MSFDVLDPHFYAGDPFPAYLDLRTNDPVHWDEKNRCWVLTRHKDVTYVSKRTDLFCSGQGVLADGDMQISIVTMDDPRHAQLRKLISRGFTPRMVGVLEKRIEEIVAACIDAIAGRGSCDFTAALSVPVPLLVIAEMIGIRPDDRERFADWSDTMIAAAGRSDDIELLVVETMVLVVPARRLFAVPLQLVQDPRPPSSGPAGGCIAHSAKRPMMSSGRAC